MHMVECALVAGIKKGVGNPAWYEEVVRLPAGRHRIRVIARNRTILYAAARAHARAVNHVCA